MRLNQQQPPFDNPAIRRALLGAVSQADYMNAVTGPDRSYGATGSAISAPTRRWPAMPAWTR